jgi:L-ribulose-5-phosphate 4-epimerase
VTGAERGYVQFRYEWEPGTAPAHHAVPDLLRWRDRLHRAGLIGVTPGGIGFGNLSVRGSEAGTFVVTGTGTGHHATLSPEHLTLVTGCDLDANFLTCRGPVVASSESLSHAAVYGADPAACAVVHVHHLALWERLHGRAPTSDSAAEAGTPAMARAIARLLGDPAARAAGLFVMGGHREGLIAFGASVAEAAGNALAALSRS